MFFKKNYHYGHLGLKGNQSHLNRLIGAGKYNGIDLVKNYVHHANSDKPTHRNYLEKK
jgi:hypothetical protein